MRGPSPSTSRQEIRNDSYRDPGRMGWLEASISAARRYVCTWPIATCGPETVVGRFRGIVDVTGRAAGRSRTQMTPNGHEPPHLPTITEAEFRLAP